MIYMLGGAGVRNFGDEMMVRNWLDFYGQAGLSRRVIVDGANATFLESFFGSRYGSVQFVNTFNKLKYNGPKLFWASMVRGLRFFENGGFSHYITLRKLAKQMEDVELVHLHGGGYLNDIWPQSAFLLGVAAAIKLRYGSRLVATGIGFLPLTPPPSEFQSAFRKVIETFDLFETRDQESCEFLRKYASAGNNVFFGLDDTYLATVETLAPNSDKRALHFSYYSSIKAEIKSIVESLPPRFVEQFDKIYFWQCTNGDDECLELVNAQIPRTVPLSLSELVFRPLPISNADFMITARFHPHLFAARAGSKGVFRRDGGYYDVKHGSISSLGSPFRQLSEFDAGRLEETPFFDRMTALDAERVAMKRKFAAAIVDLSHSAR